MSKTDELLSVYLFQLINKFCNQNLIVLPIKKIILFLWKVLLVSSNDFVNFELNCRLKLFVYAAYSGRAWGSVQAQERAAAELRPAAHCRESRAHNQPDVARHTSAKPGRPGQRSAVFKSDHSLQTQKGKYMFYIQIIINKLLLWVVLLKLSFWKKMLRVCKIRVQRGVSLNLSPCELKAWSTFCQKPSFILCIKNI